MKTAVLLAAMFAGLTQLFLMNDRVMLNRSVMRKFGFRLGEVTLSFHRRER